MLTILMYAIAAVWYEPVLQAVGIGLAGITGYLFILLQAWLRKKIKNEKIRVYVSAVLDLISTAVLSVQQTFVDDLKKDGKFDKEMQKKAFDLAFAKVKAGITEESKQLISEIYPDVEQWIKDELEAFIQTTKS